MAHSERGQWSYPLEETDGNAQMGSKRRDTFGSVEKEQHARTSTQSYRRPPSDAYNVMSDSEETKQRRQSVKANVASTTRKHSRNQLREKAKEEVTGPRDDSAWIHRDKLAQIEIQEMVEAGIAVRPGRRSLSAGAGATARSSRSASRPRKTVSRAPSNEGLPGDRYGMAIGSDEVHGRSSVPPMPIEDEDEPESGPDFDSELRTPEEVAAERDPSRSLIPRPGTSRIPVSKASPVPMPSNVVSRDSPLPRSRNGSGAWSGGWDETQYARRPRSNSMGSHQLLEDQGVRTPPPRSSSSQKHSSNESSPPKSRIPATKSSARKASVPSDVESSTSDNNKDRKLATSQRPTSRSGLTTNSRPSTSHRSAPEGEPPWIAGMYKPDPRLPPDQQMLPTHAKRLMQDQWEKDGKPSTVYDREFKALNDRDLPPPPMKSQLPPPSPRLNSTDSPQPSPRLKPRPLDLSPNSTMMNAWPLASPSIDQRSEPPPSPRPSTRGGLRLTPTIPAAPSFEKKVTSPRNEAAKSPLRIPDFNEKEEAQSKKKGCGCCIVM